MSRRLPAILAVLLLSAPAHAGNAPTRNQTLLLTPATPAAQRAAFTVAAREQEAAGDPLAAGEALYYVGQSFDRESRPDSAAACYRRAITLRGAPEERLALADLLLLRRSGDDVREAWAMLDTVSRQADQEGDPAADAYRARLGWAEFLMGRHGEALERFSPIEEKLTHQLAWRYRLGLAHLEAGSARRAFGLLMGVEVAARGQDADVMSALGRAADKAGMGAQLDNQLSQELGMRDKAERAALDRLGARRVRFAAADGFALGGIALPSAAGARTPALIVLLAAADTLPAYDSLAVAAHAAGYAVMLLDLRGSGWSVSPVCPTPDTWQGRERAMQTLCAGDAREALRALALLGPVDTTRYAVCGAGAAAPVAVEAAQRDRRVNALMLLGPEPAVTDRGVMLGMLQRLAMPIAIGQAPEDFLSFGFYEDLYQVSNRGASRVIDARAGGSGLWPLRHDPEAVKRLLLWLKEKKPDRPKSGTPPTARRTR